MSLTSAAAPTEPACLDHDHPTIDLVIEPRARDLGGGFHVRRILPAARRRQLGPWTFLDHMGPLTVAPGVNADVRPHPHVNLATVTYLFDGEMIHRDSLGTVQAIRPGDLNWMSAGRGIVHSERSDPARLHEPRAVHGLQAWVALPVEDEEHEPTFEHVPAARLPVVERGGATLRVIAGAAFGARSPVTVRSPLFYVDVAAHDGATIDVPGPDEHVDRGAYLVDGAVRCGDQRFEAGRLLVFARGAAASLVADGPARLVLLGGAPLPEPRHIWWNFVSSRPERIEEAKRAWKERRFPAIPGDDDDLIPLPE